ncbi:transporter, partial [Pseudomonas laurentiana]|nr:transporter [Pseudomonas laurentiana]
MDNLPLAPLLGALALALIWSALFAAVDAARQHLLQRRNGQQGSGSHWNSLLPPSILCASLGKLLVL